MAPLLALFFFAAASPEQRAVDYLAREVESWPRKNHCFSCHNNGDAARALFAAGRVGYVVQKTALAETMDWLELPEKWGESRPTPGMNDGRLAHIQFSAALAEMSPGGSRLTAAAEHLLRFQEPDGSWEIDTGGAPGAPVTYGTALATFVARRTLQKADAARFADAIQRASGWFEQASPANITDAAAILMALPRSVETRRKCLDLIRGSQTSAGGWGPQPGAPAEVFDTALVLLALDAARETGVIERGRAYLLSQQQSFGGWPETTRPSGHESYAEHISTTAWALQALLATDPKRH